MILILLLGGAVIAIVRFRGPALTAVSGTTPIDNGPRSAGPHLSLLTRMVRNAERPPDWLVDCAVAEAWDAGDWQTADRLANAFLAPKAIPSAPPASEPSPSEPTDAPVAFQKQSPLDGVKDDDWNDFITSLAKEPPSFDSPTHRGVFHHSKRRLAQLGIDPNSLTDADAQYQALEKDLLDLNERALTRDIKARIADIVTLDNEEHVITQSGLLALLKSGGPRGAEKWLTDPEDRKKYPMTTEVFLRANGIF